MPPHVFNEWRANNDIPALFKFLHGILPGFEEWTKSLPFDSRVMLRIVPTGALFRGDSPKVAFEYSNEDPSQRTNECFDGDIDDAKSFWETRKIKTKIYGEFMPYFKWAQTKFGRKRFFIFDKLNDQQTDTFQFTRWERPNAPNARSSAFLLNHFRVLDLGQVEIGDQVLIGKRNLDFANLDYLTISGTFHGSYQVDINFSSCRELLIRGAELAFITFYQCAMQKFTCSQSRLQDIRFEKVTIFDFRLRDSYVNGISFDKSIISPNIENCDLRRVSFSPLRGAAPYQTATTYRLFRSAFQAKGQRQEASEAYFRERIYERKSDFHPYIENRKLFPPMFYNGRIRSVVDSWRDGKLQGQSLRQGILKALFSRLKLWSRPKYILRMLGFRIRWAISMFQYLIWGYGERPFRIFILALSSIAVYALLYHGSAWPNPDHVTKSLGWIDSFYFSTVTFTTLGYGDIVPKTVVLKCLCASEAALGAFTIGLVVAGFSNKGRY
jgi:uncharacterized protein YjbI with pentapeptide repeats